MTTIVTIDMGGTGATHAAGAREALSVPSMTDMGQSYAQANSARDQANTARDQANTARTQANTAYDQANTARTQANTAYGQANSAFTAANNRVLKSGDTMTGSLNFNFSGANLSIQEQSGHSVIEMGGANGAFIDMKAPNSDDYDFRIMTIQGSTSFVSNNAAQVVAFSGANVNFDSGTLFVDSVGNEVGIGTTNPTSNLHIVGNANITTGINTTTVNATTVNAQTFVTSTGDNVYATAINAYGAANTRLSASGGTLSGDLIITGNLTVSGNQTILNTEVLTTEDADIILLSNTSSTPALNAGLIVNRGTSTNTFLRWNEALDEWGWSDSGTTTYYFEDLRQGLSTTNTTFATINTTFATLNTSAGTQNTAITTANDQANTARGQANTARDTANSAYGQANAAYSQANSAYGAANNRVLKAGDTMTGQLNVSSGGLLVTGNVGFGMPSPIFPLQVKTNTGTPPQALQLNTTDWTTTIGSAFQFGFGAATGNTYSEIRALSGGYNAWNNLVLQSGGGNVGIGTTNPGYKLDVNGIVNIAQGSYLRKAFVDNTEEFLIRGDATSWNGFISYTPSGGSSNRGFKFGAWDNAGSRNDWVTFWNGNVGIGTTSPGAKLEVSGQDSSGTIIVSGDGGSNGIRLNLKSTAADGRQWMLMSGGTSHGGAGVFNIRDGTSGNNRLTIDSSGNVGIGTTSPSTKLHLYESGAADVLFRLTSVNGTYDPLIQFTGQGNDITAEGFEIWYDNDVGDVHLSTTYPNDGATIHFHTRTGASKSTSNERLTILGNGNVGIGVTTPQRKLDVFGSGILASFGSQMSVGAVAGIHFGYSESSSNVDTYKKSAMVFERTDNHNQGGNASGKIHFLLHNSSSTSASGTNSAVLTLDTDSNATLGSARVGIGTTSPTNALHVNGAIRTSSVAGRVAYFRAASTNSDNIIQFEESDGSQIWEIVGRGYGAGQPFYIYKTGGTGSGFKYIIDSSGNHTFNGNMTVSGTITESSSVTLKENISPITNALDSITKLVGVTYDRKDGSAQNRAGLIAEEVGQILPNVVNGSGIQYTNLIAYLVESIKELKAEIDVLKRQ